MDRIGERAPKTNPVHKDTRRHTAGNPSLAAKPQNSNSPPTPQRPAAGTPALQPPETANRTRDHRPKPEPVHARPRQHPDANHHTTAKPRNTNGQIVSPQSATARPDTRDARATDRIGKRTRKANPIHNGTRSPGPPTMTTLEIHKASTIRQHTEHQPPALRYPDSPYFRNY
jgi:hypothetical protein